MDKKKLSHSSLQSSVTSVLAALLCILIGLIVGFLVLLAINPAHAWGDGFVRILKGGFHDAPYGVGKELANAAPLIMTGLSVAVAFKTGLFNIGAPGQYLMGTLVSLSVALGIPSESVPVGIIWLLAFLGGMLAGALWGAIPGLLKALLNINEVLACIMTNWIAANLVTWMFDISSFKNLTESTKSGYIYKTTFNGVATPKLGLDMLFPGSQVNGGILVAIVIAIAMYILMNKTTLGYELKACGANRHAARYAGIPDKRNIVLSMAIAGALAGISGVLLGAKYSVYPSLGASMMLKGFIASVIGGLGSLSGAIPAAIILGVVEMVLTYLRLGSDSTDYVLRRCSLGGDGYAAVLLGRYKVGSQLRLVTVNSDGKELGSLDLDGDVLSMSACGRYVAVLFADRLVIYNKNLKEYATLQGVSSAGDVLMRSDGSAVLAGSAAASVFLP